MKAKDKYKAPIPCGGYSVWTDWGNEHDCHYARAGSISCEDCICTPGGKLDPRTGHKFRQQKAAT